MTDPLVATKFFIPPLSPNQIVRPRLLRRMGDTLSARLALVCAPAGYGKTSLAAEWAAGLQEAHVGWLSLDPEDGDPARFLRCLAALLPGPEAEGSAADQGLLFSRFGERPARNLEPALDLLLNELVTFPGPVVLVLEDYHAIQSEPVHQAVAYLVDHLPPHAHLVITSRAEPPLPLARWRGRGQLVELRARDLRFTQEEATAFLERRLPRPCAPETASALVERTEGWIAGLQMAVALLAEREEGDDFIQSFTGSTRYIMDYLVEEVLEQQPQRVQEFLLQTSVLDRLCAGLCDELLAAASPSGEPAGPAAGLLDYLERSNLFLVPLDERREWYRYHHLLADLLRKRLNQMHPGLAPVLHRRAGEWYARQGYLAEAIEHGLAAEEFDRAANWIEQAAEASVNRSETSLFLGWVEKLPDSAVRARPKLALFHALGLLLHSQKLETIAARLDQVEAEPAADLAGEAAALRSLLLMVQGQVPDSIRLARAALERLPEDRRLFRSLAADNLGMCLVLSGDLAAAVQAFELVVQTARQAGSAMMAAAALSNLAGLQFFQGRLQEARASYQEVLSAATGRGGRRLPFAGKALYGLGELAREMNDLPGARRCLTEALELQTRSAEIGAVVTILALARLRRDEGDWDGAWELLYQAQNRAAESRLLQMDDLLVEAVQLRFWIDQGRYAQAEAWVRERRLDENPQENLRAAAGRPGFDLVEPGYLALARLRLGQGRAAEAQEILETLLEIDTRKGRLRRLVEVLCLQALAREATGERDQALAVLGRALELAAPHGFVRTFLDEGAPLVRLIGRALRQEIVPEYAGRLLAAAQGETAGQEPGPRPAALAPASAGGVEPLSPRELEVLRLVAGGLSNAEIAARLVISLSTVKGHIANIFGKLGVSSRTQAAASARALGLLD